MTKSKKRGHRYPTKRTATATSKAAACSLKSPLGLVDYVLLNIVFIAFCLLQWGLLSVVMNDMPGLMFFFVFIMLGFVLVSVFDFFSCRLTTDDGAVMDANNTPGEAG